MPYSNYKYNKEGKLFADDIIIHLENTNEWTEKLLELIRKVNRVAGYKKMSHYAQKI